MTARTVADWLRILQACGVRAPTAIRWAPVFADTIKPDTFSAGDKDLADFLPTILHESAMLEQLVESGNYSADRIRQLGGSAAQNSRWRSLVARADGLARNEAAFFEACYGGRMGNGPEGGGDGALYRGRGLVMLTGRDNYAWQGERSGQDLLGIPDLAAQPHFALQFAIDWWEKKIPDAKLGDARAVRLAVNGGTIGLAEVEALADKARAALA